MQLDSLRGLAAASVVLCHATNVLPGVYDSHGRLWWFTETPLAILRAGHAAVILFFVLSGFVLVLPFLQGRVSYPAFVARRILRIWIPYAAAMTAAVACAIWFYPNPVAGLSTWANGSRGFPDASVILDHLLLVGTFPNGTYNPVVWSLVHEMRISLIFPLLVQVLRLGAAWRVLGAAIALSAASLVVERLPIWSGSTDVPITLHYAGLFILGMLLAREMPKLRTLYGRFPVRTKALLWLLALTCYSHQAWIFSGSKLQQVPLYRDGLIAVGVSLFILFALSPSGFSEWLQCKPLVFLGKISYSVYLCHAVILLSLVHSFYGKIPLVALWMGTGLLTLVISVISYKWIELPAIVLSRSVRLRREFSNTQRVNLLIREKQTSDMG